MKRLRYQVIGRVQGVGFRYYTQTRARTIGLTGWVKNCGDGSVLCEAQGSNDQLDTFEQEIWQGPALSHVRNLHLQEVAVIPDEESFSITY